jgi:hypothetical protein
MDGDGWRSVEFGWPGDGTDLLMTMPPSGMRAMLSVFFMAPKSMRSTS